jgi:hypothetical protein
MVFLLSHSTHEYVKGYTPVLSKYSDTFKGIAIGIGKN